MSLSRLHRSVAMLPLLFVCATGHSQGLAQTFPSKPLTFVVPFAAGGPVDVESRVYAKTMGELTGQRIVVDYKPGAASSIGAAFVARAPADGYTLLIGTAGFPLMPSQYKNLPFDILKDFAPLSQMSERTSVLLTRPSFPPKDFKEYVAYAKSNPGRVTYGYSSGSSLLVGSWLHSLSGTKVTFVGYKGVGPASADILGDRLDVLSSTLAVALPLVKAGKARALVVLGTRRSKLLPSLQTVREQGLPGFDYAGNWFGFLAPAATPPEIVGKLADTFRTIANAPDVIRQLEAQGSNAIGSTPQEFRKLIATEVVRWERVIKESGLKLGDG